jgi:D-alanine-D-alanine ligase
MNVAIIYGGKSAEHEISLRSAKNVFDDLDRSRFNPVLIKITKDGRWLTDINKAIEMSFSEISDFGSFEPEDEVLLFPGSEFPFVLRGREEYKFRIDVVFPVLHGPNGEDGTVQGLFKLLGIPFVGSSLLGSAIGMDKEVMKRLLTHAGITIGDYISARNGFIPDFEEVKSLLGLPVFIKPANMGSSVGITKVWNESQYSPAIELAYKYDFKIVIEAHIDGKEIECAVMGNENPEASVTGEIRAKKEFYDYEAKYLDDHGYEIIIPSGLGSETDKLIREIAVNTYQVLECEGLGRVDFFLTKDNEVIVNEINTIPGFTSISMYPMLWRESGISYKDQISKLIDLAVSRYKSEKKLKNSL